MGDCGRSSWRDTLIKQTIAAQEAQESTTDMARSTRLVILIKNIWGRKRFLPPNINQTRVPGKVSYLPISYLISSMVCI